MKNQYILASAALAALALSACEDMDTTPNGGWVTEEQKKEVYSNDPDKGLAAIDGAFKKLNTLMPNESSIGSVHNDFGYPSIMLFTDANGEDAVSTLIGYNWFSHEIRFTDRSISSYVQQMVWQDFYSYISAANTVVASFDDNSTAADDLFNIAQGYALRAFCYFQMAQMYQFTYVGHEDSPCVPIVTDENSDECALNGAKRATVKEVYDQVYSDLDKAIEHLASAAKLGKLRKSKYLIDLATAYGLRARVNLVTRNWAAALSDANNAIENSSASPASIADVSVPTFYDIAEDNWMWGIDVAETDETVSSGIVNWISMLGSLNYGYAKYSGGFRISSKLFASIPETDVRKGWWLNEDGVAQHVADGAAVNHITGSLASTCADYFKCEVGEFYLPLTNVKFAPYKNVGGTTTNANDIPLMRIEEMYLIKAEAELMSGADGLATLTSFVKTYRDPEYSYTGSNVHEEIWRQRRIELWGEGMSWFDMMRLGVGIDRRNTGFESLYVYKMEANDTKLLWQIPETEVEANAALSEADYNPVTPTPSPVTDEEVSVEDEKIAF